MTKDVRVGIITRLTTQNAGNEALSVELINFVQAMVPDALVIAIDRYPRYFEHLKISALTKHGGSPLAEFDALADRLIRRFFRSYTPLPLVANECSVRLDLTAKELPASVRKIKNAIGVRRNLARFGFIGRQDVITTVSLCGSVDLLVWNPAGEFHPTGNRDQTFRLLLLIRIAQKLGVATAIVNHSLEIEDNLLQQVVQHVYRQADCVCVRDAKSVEVALALGVSPARVREAPDLVFLASREPGGPSSGADIVPKGTIGMSINGLEAMRGADEWNQLIDKLQKFERPFVFVSNAMNHDLAFGYKLLARAGGTVIARQPNYRELRTLYRGMDVLISSRLHASILSLCEGTPVVSLEPSVFKLSAVFQQLDYPIPTDRLGNPGWSERVSEHVARALSQKAQLAAFGEKALARQTANIVEAYRPIFELAARKAKITVS